MKLIQALATAVVVLVATQASAVSVRMKFKTFSSGPSVYACNAGLMHRESSVRACYFEGTNQACTPSTCSNTSTVCDTRCVCTTAGGGEYLKDYMIGSTLKWADNGVVGETNVQSHTKGAGELLFNQLVSDGDAINTRIKELRFNLGSELYGAQYFVDVCYRGPQIEYYKDGVSARFSILAQVAATDFLATGANGGDNNRDGLVIPGTVDGQKYTELADMKVKTYVNCDLQGEGLLRYSLNGLIANTGSYNTSVNELLFVISPLTGLPIGGTDLYMVSTAQSVTATGVNLLDTHLVNSTHAPRFCKVRYVFTENGVNSTKNLRKWQRHGAEMCTFTDIQPESDAPNSGGDNEGGTII